LGESPITVILRNYSWTSFSRDLTTSGSVIQQSNREKVRKFSFANRLNDIIPLLSYVWLDKNEKQMKKTLKTIILETVPAKCDI
jgi:hypothetical protein